MTLYDWIIGSIILICAIGGIWASMKMNRSAAKVVGIVKVPPKTKEN